MGRKTDKLAGIINEKIDDEERAFAAAKLTKLFSPEVQKAYKKAIKSHVGYKPEKYGTGPRKDESGTYVPTFGSGEKGRKKNNDDNRYAEHVERPSTRRPTKAKVVDSDSDDRSEDEPDIKREVREEPKPRAKKAVAQTRSTPVKDEIQHDEKPAQARPITDSSNSQTKFKSWRDAL